MPYQQVQATPPPPPEQEEGWDWWQKALLGVGAIGAGVLTGGALAGAMVPALGAAGVMGGASIGAGVGGGIAQAVPQMGPGGASATGTMTGLTQGVTSMVADSKPPPQQRTVPQGSGPGQTSLYGGVPSSMRASAPELAGMTRAQAQALGISEEVWQRGQSPLGIYNMQAYG